MDIRGSNQAVDEEKKKSVYIDHSIVWYISSMFDDISFDGKMK